MINLIILVLITLIFIFYDDLKNLECFKQRSSKPKQSNEIKQKKVTFNKEIQEAPKEEVYDSDSENITTDTEQLVNKYF